MRRPSLLVIAFAAVAVLTAGCGSSGRDLRAPVDGAVSPTRSTASTIPTTTATAGSAVAPANQFSLTSPAFAAGAPIPGEFACTGPSPALAWTGVPADTKELALVVVDPTANDFVHWVVTGITPVAGSVANGTAPTGAAQLANSSGRLGWTGPCPPAGSTHTYNFMLFALPEPVTLTGQSPKDALNSLQTAAQGQLTILSGTFQVGGATPGSGSTGTTAKGSGTSASTR